MPINKATQQDIPVLNQLINSAYRGDVSRKGWTTEADILGGIRIDEQALASYFELEDTTILKYVDDSNTILGTVCLQVKNPELYLGMFAVSPNTQGKGIGNSLLQAAEEFALANGCDKIAISVISIRKELIDWYERKGYQATGSSIAFDEIEGRFGDPKLNNIRLIAMEKKLVDY